MAALARHLSSPPLTVEAGCANADPRSHPRTSRDDRDRPPARPDLWGGLVTRYGHLRPASPYPDIWIKTGSCYAPRMLMATEERPVALEDLTRIAAGRYGALIKAVIDVERHIMLADAEMHSDQEAELLASGSRQQDLWGINLYPDLPESEWVEFDSMINLRPTFGNSSRGVDDPEVRAKILSLVRRLITR